MLLDVYDHFGGTVSQTAREFCCSRNVESLVLKERQKTNFGAVRSAHRLQQEQGLALSPHTVRHILRRHDLSQPQKQRPGSARSGAMPGKTPTSHSTSKSTSSISLHLERVPVEVCKHVRGYKASPYHWTGIDPMTRSNSLAYCCKEPFTNGLAFVLLVHLQLRVFSIFDPANVQPKRIPKGHWIDKPICEVPTAPMMRSSMHLPPPKSWNRRTTSASTLQWTYMFNCLGPHFGRDVNGQTPLQGANNSLPWITEKSYLFSPHPRLRIREPTPREC